VIKVQNKVKQVVDLGHQARRHPWWLFGASVAVGFASGLLAPRHRRAERAARASWLAEAPHSVDEPISSSMTRTLRSELVETLTLAARAAVIDLARQALVRSIPAVVRHFNGGKGQSDQPIPDSSPDLDSIDTALAGEDSHSVSSAEVVLSSAS
jgi:hypothetical protein